MAFWTILGIAPTTNEEEIRHAYACAVCGALDGRNGPLPQALAEAYAKALDFARNSALPHNDAEKPAPLEAEESAGLVLLLQRSQKLVDAQADEQEWLDFTSSSSFLALQDDPRLLDWLTRLSARPYPGMASALYTAYGFASSRALQAHPASGPLRQALAEYLQLPAEDLTHLSQQDILRLTSSCLNALLALQKEPQSVHLWQQVFQVSDFLLLRHQPHFLLALGRFLHTHTLSGECLLTLAEACTRQMRRCPCAAELAARLPEYDTSQAWSPPELYAGFLLQGNADIFFDGARNKLFFLLERTAENFGRSSQRHPWDYVFARPQFSLVKHDAVFLERLTVFLQHRDLPLKFWQSLHDAYLEDFLKLKDVEKSPLLWHLREQVRDNLEKKQSTRASSGRLRFRLSPSLLGVLSVLYLIAAFWVCFHSPLIGIPLLLAPLALLFL